MSTAGITSSHCFLLLTITMRRRIYTLLLFCRECTHVNILMYRIGYCDNYMIFYFFLSYLYVTDFTIRRASLFITLLLYTSVYRHNCIKILRLLIWLFRFYEKLCFDGVPSPFALFIGRAVQMRDPMGLHSTGAKLSEVCQSP